MADTDAKRRTGSRTQKRSRSGAHHPCPHCGKRVRTAKAVEQHIADIHPEEVA